VEDLDVAAGSLDEVAFDPRGQGVRGANGTAKGEIFVGKGAEHGCFGDDGYLVGAAVGRSARVSVALDVVAADAFLSMLKTLASPMGFPNAVILASGDGNGAGIFRADRFPPSARFRTGC
jgi:hypothetical protein